MSPQHSLSTPAHLSVVHPPPLPQAPKANLAVLLSWGVLIALLAGSWKGADMRPADLVRDSANMAEYAASFFPPNFKDWRYYLHEMVVTLQIALWGTALAVVCAVPLGLLSSSNIAPVWVRQPIRRLMDAARAINEMVFAMLFIVAVGLGPFAGVLALWIHTTGILAKLFSEAVEAIDPQPVCEEPDGGDAGLGPLFAGAGARAAGVTRPLVLSQGRSLLEVARLAQSSAPSASQSPPNAIPDVAFFEVFETS